ncbi:hypothetical protein TrCOL_g4154 [Triparma columacea]|nr:hypothetical protein TrCOL_g4154 [Triparma columacea]
MSRRLSNLLVELHTVTAGAIEVALDGRKIPAITLGTTPHNALEGILQPYARLFDRIGRIAHPCSMIDINKACGKNRMIASDVTLTMIRDLTGLHAINASFHVRFFNKHRVEIERVLEIRRRTGFGGLNESQAQRESRVQHQFGGALESDVQRESRVQHQFGGALESDLQRESRVQHQFGGALESDLQRESRVQHQFGGALESDVQRESRVQHQFGGALESDLQRESGVQHQFGGALESQSQRDHSFGGRMESQSQREGRVQGGLTKGRKWGEGKHAGNEKTKKMKREKKKKMKVDPAVKKVHNANNNAQRPRWYACKNPVCQYKCTYASAKHLMMKHLQKFPTCHVFYAEKCGDVTLNESQNWT